MSRALLQRHLADAASDFSPFLVLGDPDFETSVRLACRAYAAGVRMLEVGIAYDDPCADGPAIQAASARARSAGSSTQRALEAMDEVRRACPELALNMLVYGNLVHARGVERFCADAVAHGASSLLVPDIPHEEAASLRAACRAQDLGHVVFVGPMTDEARCATLAAEAEGAFVYLAATQGVTGATEAQDRAELVRRLTTSVRAPVCVGFGITSRRQAEAVFEAGASIAVVGSHFARAIGAAIDGGAQRSGVVAAFDDALRPFLLREIPSERPSQCSSS